MIEPVAKESDRKIEWRADQSETLLQVCGVLLVFLNELRPAPAPEFGIRDRVHIADCSRHRNAPLPKAVCSAVGGNDGRRNPTRQRKRLRAEIASAYKGDRFAEGQRGSATFPVFGQSRTLSAPGRCSGIFFRRRLGEGLAQFPPLRLAHPGVGKFDAFAP